MKSLLLSILIAAGAALPASTYDMEGGSLRRENRSLNPAGINGPVSMVWKQPQAGLGMGTPLQHPLILSDRVIQPYQGGLSCLDRQSGTVLWRRNMSNLYNTPAYDPQRNLIYVADRSGNLQALRPSDGSLAWSQNSGNATGYDMASATLVNGFIYLGNGNGSLACINADTHQVVWTTLLMAGKGITTPAVDAGKIYVASAGKKIFRLNLANGAIEWQQSFSSLTAPISAITLGPDKGYFMTSESNVFAFDRGSGSILWTYHTLSWGYSNLSLAGDILLEASDDRYVRALNAHTGAVIWATDLAGNFGRCTPIVSCGVVFVSGCAYEYYALDLRTGSLLWTYRTNVGNSFVDWAEADGELYVMDATGAQYRFQSATQDLPIDCDPGHALATPTALPSPLPQPGLCTLAAGPDLTLWLSADQGVTADAQGKVTRWNDLSGYGHHAISTDTMRPTRISNAWGGRPVIRFDGIETFMSIARSGENGLIHDNAPITVITAMKYASGGPASQVLFSNYHRQAGAISLGRFNGEWYLSAGLRGGSPSSSFRVMSFRYNGPSPVIRQDGLAVPFLSSTQPVDGKRAFVIGRGGANHITEAFKGDLYALLVFKRALSDAEIAAYEQCLLLTPHTPSVTPTATHTATSTATATATPTFTATASSTDTATATATATPTWSFSETPTLTPTSTATQTGTDTPTLTPTSTLTLVPTELPSPKPTPGPSLVPTSIPTQAPTPKPTRDRSCDAPLIDRVMITPNPSNAAADRMVSVKLGCGADEVRIEIYSVAGVRLFEWVDTGKHVERGQWVHEKYPHDVDLPNGTYFVRIYVTFEGRTESAATTFVVLK